MKTNTTSQAMTGVLTNLRKLTPKRALTYGESLTIAKLQALTARKLLTITAPAASLAWVFTLPRVTVELLTAHEIQDITNSDASGYTGKNIDGSGYTIGINKNTSHTHRRFTLAHEVKHLIDYPYARVLHARLGGSNHELRHRQIERISDHFAAHFLVPSNLLKQTWARGIQDVSALAALFTVSSEAMQIRLENEGFIDNDTRPIAMYFRRAALLARHDQQTATCLAA